VPLDGISQHRPQFIITTSFFSDDSCPRVSTMSIGPSSISLGCIAASFPLTSSLRADEHLEMSELTA
jgi:hypothetical protein